MPCRRLCIVQRSGKGSPQRCVNPPEQGRSVARPSWERSCADILRCFSNSRKPPLQFAAVGCPTSAPTGKGCARFSMKEARETLFNYLCSRIESLQSNVLVYAVSAVNESRLSFHFRRDGRVAEGARLESVFRGNSNVGSNPTLSAILIHNQQLRFGSLAGLYTLLFTRFHVQSEQHAVSGHCHKVQ